MTVVTRFAPSPTGYLHVGGARTALFAWLYARHHHGRFILRIEDTDLERSTPEAVQAIFAGMQWLGLQHDEGPYFQTQRFDRYRAVIAQMLQAGTAYRCYCSKEELETMRAGQMARKEKPRYNGYWRERADAPPAGVQPVIRFKNPLVGQVMVRDQVYGDIIFENAELDDLIIARSDGTPTYNFTVVVDDMDMGITHVIRGDDHINNTPRQINIMLALGFTPPTYAHLPMILGTDGKKLSKRHGTVSVMQYAEEGILPEALLNYLVRLGWSHGDEEVFSMAQMIEKFDITAVNKSAAAFNTEKLLWLNQHYIKQADATRLAELLREHLHKLGVAVTDTPSLTRVLEPLRERSKTLVEMAQAARLFYEPMPAIDPLAGEKNLNAESKPYLSALLQAFMALENWCAVEIHHALNQVAVERGIKLGKLAQPLRVAITGGTVSPPIDITAELIGKAEVLSRLQRALDYTV